jgi:hypothetical protein
MSDLEELARASRNTPLYASRLPKQKSGRVDQVISGFCYSLGWLPVGVLAGLLIFIVLKEYIAYEVRTATEEVQRQLSPQSTPSQSADPSVFGDSGVLKK